MIDVRSWTFFGSLLILAGCSLDFPSAIDGGWMDGGGDGAIQQPLCLDNSGATTVGLFITPQQGVFDAIWEIIPQGDKIDAVVGLTQGMPDEQDWSSLAVTVMFSRDDLITGYDADTYAADVEFPYEAD
ncbi:MAG: hypothetical protein J7M25_15555, partial [Deltaproteobacteria bacterium]|nr:hypothetical protein [Deltaproteobacteria bacterium]